MSGDSDTLLAPAATRGTPRPVLGQTEAAEACLQAAQRLLEALLEGAADGHGLAHTLHLGRQLRLGAWELLKGEAGNLRHASICEREDSCWMYNGAKIIV